MKRAWIWVALLLSVGINIGILASLATSRYRHDTRFDRPRPEGSPPFARVADYLELEGVTRDRFLVIQKELFETTRRQRQELESLRRELRGEAVSEDPDIDRIEQLLNEASEVGRSLDRAMVESVLETRRILSPEQQRRYLRVLERLRMGGRRFGPHRMPPKGRRDGPDPERQK
jgi:Spy/CpxP family protein refolding chaperone